MNLVSRKFNWGLVHTWPRDYTKGANVIVHTEAQNCMSKSVILFNMLWARFTFGLKRSVKNFPTYEIGALVYVPGAAEATVKHD